MSRKQATVIDAAIAANLVALAQRLEEATTVAREASSAMANSCLTKRRLLNAILPITRGSFGC
jgi:hypothetical protein